MAPRRSYEQFAKLTAANPDKDKYVIGEMVAKLKAPSSKELTTAAVGNLPELKTQLKAAHEGVAEAKMALRVVETEVKRSLGDDAPGASADSSKAEPAKKAKKAKRA